LYQFSRYKGRHLPLDFLRGVAALGIVVHHYLAWTKIGGVQSLGTFGVYTFFILSALTMMMVYDQEFSSGIKVESLKAFYRNRFARIVPLLTLVATIYLLLAPGGSWDKTVIRLAQAVLTGTGLFAFHLPGYIGTGAGVWSLGIEILFYALFPMVCLLARSTTTWNFAIALVVSIVGQMALFSVIAPMYGKTPGTHFDFFNAFLMHAPFFVIGVLIYALPNGKIRGAFPIGAAIFLGAVASSLWIKIPVFTSQGYFLALTAACGLSVALLYRSELPPFLAAPSTFFGEISYSLYLLHPIVFNLWSKAGLNLTGPLNGTAFFLVAIGTAYLSHRFFEKPARDALRDRKASRPSDVPASSPL